MNFEMLRFNMCRRGMALKLDTGMEMTGHITALSAAKRDGFTTEKTNRKALVQMNETAVANGLPEIWSKKYPLG